MKRDLKIWSNSYAELKVRWYCLRELVYPLLSNWVDAVRVMEGIRGGSDSPTDALELLMNLRMELDEVDALATRFQLREDTWGKLENHFKMFKKVLVVKKESTAETLQRMKKASGQVLPDVWDDSSDSDDASEHKLAVGFPLNKSSDGFGKVSARFFRLAVPETNRLCASFTRNWRHSRKTTRCRPTFSKSWTPGSRPETSSAISSCASRASGLSRMTRSS